MMAIFKLQRPMFSTQANGMRQVLIYDKGRKNLAQLELSQETIDQLFDANEYKVFWEGSVNLKTGQFEAEKKIPEEEWPSW